MTRPTVHLRSAASIDPDAPVVLALAAMARVPPWLIPYTSGRPAWAYAVGETVRLLWPALGERRNPAMLFPNPRQTKRQTRGLSGREARKNRNHRWLGR